MENIPILATSAPDAAAFSAAVLVARLVFGLALGAHGAQKLFGWFGGYGLAGTAGFFEQLGFRPGKLFAGLASVSEVAAGLLIAFGFLGPVGPALAIAVMIVAVISVHWSHGFFATGNGIEVPLLYASAATALALTGPGLWSLDALLGLEVLWSPAFAAGALAAGILGGVGSLALRRPASAAGVVRTHTG